VSQGDDRFVFFSRCGGAAEALGADMAVPRSVPVRVAHELQQAGHRYLDVRFGIKLSICICIF
jgi:hypothetical protein